MSINDRVSNLVPRRLLVALAATVLLVGAAAPAVDAAPRAAASQGTIKLARLGTTRIAGGPARVHVTGPLAGEIRPEPEDSDDGDDGAQPERTEVPRPRFLDLVRATSRRHFQGLNHFDNRFAGTGDYTNTQSSNEPPDQALCVGNGMVVESVNTVIRVRSTSGAKLTEAMPLNDFFNLAPEVIRSDPLVFGDFTSDPKCYYDVDTNRWFVTLLQLGVDPDTGDFTGDSSILIGVSTSGDPTGTFSIFSLDTTNDGTDGTPSHPDCPCLGDQPLIGADANGFYVSTNEFPLFEDGFNGANIYAMSKTALAGGSAATVVMIHEPTLAEGQAYSVQPATTPPGAAYATTHNGTEFFLSALDFEGSGDDRIALWALTNTASLNSASPSVRMSVDIVDSEVYGAPPVVAQRSGPTPLRDLVRSDLAPEALGVDPSAEPIPRLNSNDDRMNQTVFAKGKIWGAVNTVVKTPGGQLRSGIAWFAVKPSFGPLNGSIASQGYVAISGANAMFPAVAVNRFGEALVAYSVAGGREVYPSAAYSRIGKGGTGRPHVVTFGVGPADGFTGYEPLDPGDAGVERWGDYSAAVADRQGGIWFATETINQRCGFQQFLNDPTCGGTRSLFANWGTTIAKVDP
jgi:hypothetical protein